MRHITQRTGWVAPALAFVVVAAPLASGAAIYDEPRDIAHAAVKSPLVEEGGGLVCYKYNQFMVKRLDSGSPTGDVSVAVMPIDDGARSPACAIQHLPREVSIPGDGYSFVGTKGNFLVLSASDPNGGVPFKILDRRDGSLRYADASDDHGLTSIADENNTLRIRFRRTVNITCSIPHDGQACWAKATREVHLPKAIAALPAPVAACAAVYKQGNVPLDDPSIIVYDVELAVPPQAAAHVLSRGEISCEPMP